MTYCLSKKSPISPSESKLLQLLDKVVPCITQPVVHKWSVTQVSRRRIPGWGGCRPRTWGHAVPCRMSVLRHGPDAPALDQPWAVRRAQASDGFTRVTRVRKTCRLHVFTQTL